MAIKMIAFGVHCGEGSYWFNGWAIFEGFIVCVSWRTWSAAASLRFGRVLAHGCRGS